MLEKLTLRQFTTFDQIDFSFAPGINIVIGENGTGKSHLLKIAYAISSASHAASKSSPAPTKAQLQKDLASKMIGVFRPDKLGRLVRSHRARGAVGGRASSSVKLQFSAAVDDWAFTFSSVSKVEVQFDEATSPKKFLEAEPIFIPTKEVLSMFPGFASLYRNRELAIDETYFDLCLALDGAPLRGPRLEAIKQLLDPIEQHLGGTVVRVGDSFYLDSENGKTEMPLVAEGIRKIATIAYLLRNGALTRRGIVFWDEPESNLNPRLIRMVAAMLMSLAAQGVQVFIGTHSFFLMKELELLRRDAQDAVPCRYITLAFDDDGNPLYEQGHSLKEVGRIVALDEELFQYDREIHAGRTG
jgi:ABC-type transport system involved in cytochrome c biogenesis ATPase subunit